jgi:hypothetical protein
MTDAAKPDMAKAASHVTKGGSMSNELTKRGMDDEAAPAKKPLKPAPSSGRSLGRAIIIASLLVTIAWVFSAVTQPRYVLESVQTNENTFIYRLDLRTGAVHFCTTQQCSELPVR